MDENGTSYFAWIHRAHVSQKQADEKRANPPDWFRYYAERIVCVLILMAITIAGLLAFVQLLGGSSG